MVQIGRSLVRSKPKGDGTLWVCGPRAERHSCTAYKCRVSETEHSLLRKWNLNSGPGNPLFLDRIPATLEYLHTYIVDTAYIPSQRRSETTQAYKKRIYSTLKTFSIAISPPQEMRVARLWPHADWQTIWKNLIATPTSEADRAVWYRVIHDIIPTNERLHRIRMSPTESCKECDNKDTIHRLTERGENKSTWEWTKKKSLQECWERPRKTYHANECCAHTFISGTRNANGRYCGCYPGMWSSE